jgi:uncharacterized membrane protein (UPF0136 family)
MGGSAHLSFAMGTVVIGAGSYAYIVKKSVPSLYGSLGLGGGFIIGGILIMEGYDIIGHVMSSTASAGLIGFGIGKYITSKKLMPAAPMIALGIVGGVYNLKKTQDCF